MTHSGMKALCFTCACTLMQWSTASLAEGPDTDFQEAHRKPGSGAMFVDAIAVRPVMIATTVVGSALFLVSLPFSALGGNVHEAAQSLVLDPAQSAFTRPLGQYE
jgi:hypothetical protein